MKVFSILLALQLAVAYVEGRNDLPCLEGTVPARECCIDVADNHNVLLRDPRDCTKYYQCVRQEPAQKNCPDGLHWSVGTNRCDWPSNAGCEERPEPTTTEVITTEASTTTEAAATTPEAPTTTEADITTTPEAPMTTEADITTTTEGSIIDDCLNGRTDPNDCCRDVPWWIDVFLKHLEDCSAYWKCERGKPVMKECPGGLHWSVTANRCEWPIFAGCEEFPKPTTTEATTTTETSIIDDCLNGRIDPNECCKAVPWPVNVFLKHSEDCGSYWKCEEGKPVLGECPAGLHWSVIINRCDWPKNAGCEEEPETEPTTTEAYTTTEASIIDDCLNGRADPNECCSDVTWPIDVFLKNSKDCGSYWKCESGEPVLKECPRGLHWSVTANRCEWPIFAECEESDPVEDCLNGRTDPNECCVSWPIDLFLKNSEDCGSYWKCERGKPVLEECPGGLHWSVTSNRCEWPIFASCE